MPLTGDIDKGLDQFDKAVWKLQEVNLRLALASAHGAAIKALNKNDTGQLRATTRYVIKVEPNQIRGVLYNPLYYAPYVHQGTGIYAVDGNGRKTPWVWVGKTAKWEGGHTTVGQKPCPWIKRGVETILPQLPRFLGRR